MANRQEQPLNAEQVVDPVLAEARLLCEVYSMLTHLDQSGNVSEQVKHDIKQNKQTALCETAMPYAVTTMYHDVEEIRKDDGGHERVIMWLGKTAVQVAAEGALYHFSEPALRRVDVEAAEARQAQQTLRPGIAQVFISPKMSPKDAPVDIAKAEHLHDDDSLRVSSVVTDSKGKIVARKMQSLLVQDIPLASWVAMLKDNNNIFGKSFDIRDEESALSVMELFAQLDLPEEDITEGPVTLVEAVLPYIEGESAQDSVRGQLSRFREDQKKYEKAATTISDEWFRFDLELARSFRQGRATFPIRQFMLSSKLPWNANAYEVINQHAEGNTQYRMSDELAAVLEMGARRMYESRAAAFVGNEKATQGVSPDDMKQIIREETRLQAMYANGASQEHIYQQQMEINSLVLGQNIKTGGGCAGNTANMFGENGNQLDTTPNGIGELGSPFTQNSQESKANKASWKWKKGVCQVSSCSSPKPTEVGPCSVCRHCQAEFDAGRDPTKHSARPATRRSAGVVALGSYGSYKKRETKRQPRILQVLQEAA